MILIFILSSMFTLLGISLAVSAAVSDKMTRENMRDMTVTGALRRR